MPIVLKTTVNTEGAEALLSRLEVELSTDKLDLVVDGVAGRTFAKLVMDTKAAIGVRPDGSRWNIEQPENHWIIERPGDMQRKLMNKNKVMGYLERGTAGAGTGYIVPRVKKLLFIPLRRVAAAGWNENLKRGVDYILARRVRGITPRRIVAQVAEWAAMELETRIRGHVEKAVRNARRQKA